jgi:endonuclease I
MPFIYINKNFAKEDIKNTFFSAEHIYPQSLLNIKQSNDMHNIIRTLNTLNVNRSNYKFHDEYNKYDKHWIELEYDNYVNHKDKIFIPNNDSKGFISRAILYMYREYKCNPTKIIDIEILKKWYYNFPPKHDELYHNMVVKRIQNKNNIFISNYNKKNKGVKKIFETL